VNRILIVEDETRISSFLEKGLGAAGYATTVVGDGEDAVLLADDTDFDLLILDLGLPGLDGQEVLRRIRAAGQRMPVIILTARRSVEQTVAGLEGGADDYVTKPFRFEELLARVRARLRAPGRVDATVLDVAPVSLDLRTRRATVDGDEIELSAREFLLAETLMRHRGAVLSREQILSHVWGLDFDPGSNVVDVYVGYLRRKLGRDVIETVRGVGYRVPGDIRRPDGADDSGPGDRGH
jgi:DNA-binding response OmpR family regulator